MTQPDENNNTNSKELVFYIRVQYRRNSSWQGIIQWVDGKRKRIFRSVLELGNLIHDARQKASKQGGTKTIGEWEE